MHLVLLLLLGVLMHATRSFAIGPSLGQGPAGTVLAGGFLLLAAFVAGDLFKRIGLPRLTGYLATGIVAGPDALALVTSDMLRGLKMVSGVAIALIALTAGAEMDMRRIRPLLASIASITLIAVVGTTVLLTGTVLALTPFLPFMAALTPLQVGAVALVLGITLTAQSPAVVVALRDDTSAEGPMIRTVLAVVVIADLVIITLFAAASTVAKATLGGGVDAAQALARLAWEILGSLGIGAVIGLLMTLYFAKVAAAGSLFVVVVAFVMAEVGQRLHLDPLLLALAAGILIRNATTLADRLHDDVMAAAQVVYVLFFALAGATLHLHDFFAMGAIAVALALVRAAGLLTLTPLAGKVARSPAAVRRYAGFGLLPQAGLALALALLFARTFPALGEGAAALVFGVVALNELIAPVLFRMALIRSGEADQIPEPQADESGEMLTRLTQDQAAVDSSRSGAR